MFIESYQKLVKAYNFNHSDVKARLLALMDSENINVLPILNTTLILTFEISETFKTGGCDSLIFASLIEHNIKEIYSHDKNFDKNKLLKRFDPI